MDTTEYKAISWRGELLRKLTHIGALVIPAGYYFLGLSRMQALGIMVPIALSMLVIDISRLRQWWLWDIFKPLIAPMVRQNEERGDFTGATYILITACFTIALFPKAIAVLALAFIIVGDPASAIIGKRLGKHRFKNKSIEGSLAFLVAASIAALVAPELPLWVTFAGALVDDNATVPLVSGLFMLLAIKVLAV